MLIATRAARSRQSGTSMIEVLVSIVIVVLGLLGLAGLQSRASLAEVEAFQRAQALVLMQDMVDRINANRKAAMSYVTSAPLGTPGDVQACANLTGAALDKCEWNNALLGAAETNGGIKVGAMTGARGCVFNITPTMPREMLVVVSWQGTIATKEPGNACGAAADYGGAGFRRSLTASVVIGCLQNTVVGSAACVTP